MPSQTLNVTFDEVRDKNLEQLKLLNNVIFPIKFPDQVYRDCMQFKDLTALAYHNDVLVAAIAARCERQAATGKARLYIASLGTLAPYRGYGIGTKLMERCFAGVAEDPNIVDAYVHVQSDNEDAIRFYQRFGFEVAETVKDYYKKLACPDAVILVKKMQQQ